MTMTAPPPAGLDPPAGHQPQSYGSLRALNVGGTIRESVDERVLTELVDDFLGILDTSSAVYEVNGDYALGIFTSGWCRYMDERSRALAGPVDNRAALDSGSWHCHESCWQTSRESMETGAPVDRPCLGGINLYAVPIRARGEIVGSLNMGYGDPPRDPETLLELSRRYQVPVAELERRAAAYGTRDGFLVEIAKRRLHASAQLLGSMVERREAERELEQLSARLARSNADLERFAYVASHDLREPLRMVAAYVELLAQRYRGRLDADADDYIAFAVDGAHRMQRMIDDLLQYSRLGSRAVDVTDVAVDGVLDDVIAELQLAIEESGAVVSRDVLPVVRGDASQLQRVFANLLGNALKFRAVRPLHVHVGVGRREGEWLFSVADNGIGFDPAHATRIFELFQRLHGPAEYAGSGMGLAIVKRIVERQGGRAWGEGRPGDGATFFFTVPDGAIPGATAGPVRAGASSRRSSAASTPEVTP